VIFARERTQRAMGMAEVTLILENMGGTTMSSYHRLWNGSACIARSTAEVMILRRTSAPAIRISL